MTSKKDNHKTPTVTIRFDAKLHEAFLQQCENEGLSKNQMIKKMTEKYLYNY